MQIRFASSIFFLILITFFGFNQEKVNWFTADAFCDYHGMHLISFPFAFEDQIIDELTGKLEIAGKDLTSLKVVACSFSWHLDVSK